MKPLSLILFCITSLQLFAQEELKKKTVVFEGYLMLEDTIPVENAYLINYRTLKVVATDSTGFFRTYAEEDDSLMINHLTIAPKVVHANNQPKSENTIRVEFRHYMIEPVISNSYQFQMANFEKNIKLMYAQLQKLGYHSNISKSIRINPYDPDELDPGLTVRLNDLFRFLKKKR